MYNYYIIKENIVEIYLPVFDLECSVVTTQIDLSSLSLVSCIDIWWAEKKRNNFYALGLHQGRGYRMHRLITACPVGLVVDHINHKTLDNRDKNLKVCTSKANSQNQESVYEILTRMEQTRLESEGIAKK